MSTGALAKIGTNLARRYDVLKSLLGLGELNWTTDQKRLFVGEEYASGVQFHGAVATEAEMILLYHSTARGCYKGDLCLRTDTSPAIPWICISGNGKTAAEWMPIITGLETALASALSAAADAQASALSAMDLATTATPGRVIIGSGITFDPATGKISVPASSGGSSDIRSIWLRG